MSLGVYTINSTSVDVGGFSATHDASVQNGFGTAGVWERTSSGINDTIIFEPVPLFGVAGSRAEFSLSEAILGASNLGFGLQVLTLGDVISSDDLLSALLILDQFSVQGTIDFLGDDGSRVDLGATNSAFVSFSTGLVEVTFLDDMSEVPLPAALPLFALGFAGLSMIRRRRSVYAA